MNTDTDTYTETCNNTPYQSDDEENQYKNIEREYEPVTYHLNPERIRHQNPKSRAEQAYLFCNACKQWKKLSDVNIRTIDYSLFSLQKQYYTSGSCLTNECYDEVKRHITACLKAEEDEERFWNRVDTMERRRDQEI
jgi:hypothetical protein